MASGFGFPDRIAGLQQLAQRYPSMDLDRVGIVSGLGIGDSIYGMLEHPEFYKVGVVFDLEDIRFMPSSWNELFTEPSKSSSTQSGHPLVKIYAEHQAASLQGKLLLIHNMMDPEPPVTTTLRMVATLQDANKDFDLCLLPNVGHEPSSYAMRRTWDYLVENLQGVEPPKGFKLFSSNELLAEFKLSLLENTK